MLKRLLLVSTMALAVAACEDDATYSRSVRASQPVPSKTLSLMEQKDMSRYAPVLIRSYKKESELEVWKQTKSGKYALLKTFPICRWSGQLGPKKREGDRQAPEGFYAITPAQLNPNSSYYLSFNMGYPNAYDRAYGRTGAHLMVHGACSSAGCYSMTDEQIAEVYAIVREAFAGGQKAVQMQAMPFRMTAENLAKHRYDPNMAFWRNLKEGADHFEVTKQEPQVAVCGKRYVFNARPADGQRLDPSAACPPLNVDEDIAVAVAQKQRADEAKVADLVNSGTKAIKLVYADGGQHESFRRRTAAVAESNVGVFAQSSRPEFEVSRPDALESGPQVVELDSSGRERPVETSKPVQIATSLPAGPVAAPASAAPAAMPVVTAPAPQAQPVVASASSGRPLVDRILSFGGLFGSKDEPQAETAAMPAPAEAPLPPRRRGADASSGAANKKDRQAVLPPVMHGAQAALPSRLSAHWEQTN
ncbi:murein L,D-transpeptidase [Chelatococcus daeguensis]|uniref:L,D-TPase catalytic domain-containing protein n=2 Tax=Chelatococcus TaxID=28209 RepID=A0AAC9JND9_9HYPH|nr:MULTISPECIES: murein L,D-transpeptidase family protein [Chelatococcus]APF36025.1 hypothetical protein BOQ54_00655 [Chelatococcus daeguensis]KZE34666.1 hypothetical protein AVW15_15950 [Chelatococcus daeguensis]MBM3082496.1 murein L,D-transpeptidase [Chelatococcus daeguensis]CUA88640.1 Murein L,D-transpeptidase YafK [Chelatococcus sambhunathii]